ncbi:MULTISPECIES: tetratricopeptide repeat protein [Deferrisoma]
MHRQRADAYLSEGKVREASIEYQAALQELPNDPDSLYGLARCLDVLGRPGEYRKTLARVLDANAGHIGANLDLAELLLSAGNYEEALERAETALKAAPLSARGLRFKAEALSGSGRVEDAVRAWLAATDSPEADEDTFRAAAAYLAWREGAAAGLEVCREGLRRYPDSPKLLETLVSLLVESGKTEEAKELLDAERSKSPEAVWVDRVWAQLLERSGKPADAASYLEQRRSARAPSSEAWRELTVALARVLLRTGELDRAGSVLNDALKVKPGDPRLSAILADVLITTGRPDEARKYLEAAAKLEAGGRTALLLEAKMHLVSGRHRWAADALQKLIARGDMTVETHYLFAKALAGQRRWAAARAEFERVLQRVPSHPFARFDYAELLLDAGAPEAADKVLGVLPERLLTLPRVRFLRTEIFLAAGELEAAARELRELDQALPQNDRVAKLQGDLERAKGRARRALEWYREARSRNPEGWEPLLAQLAVMKELGSPLRERIREVEDYLRLQGEVPIVLNYLATLYYEEGKLEEAASKIDRSLFLEPNYWSTRYMKAKIIAAQGDLAKASVEFREAINLNPYQPHAYNDLAALLLRQGRVEEAEAVYREFLDRVPGEPYTANNLANLYLTLGRTEEALALARLAVAGAPGDPRVADTLGWALETAGLHEEAEPVLRFAAAKAPEDPEVLLHRAQNLVSLGRRDEARSVLNRLKPLPGAEALEAKVEALRERMEGNGGGGG